MNPPVFGGFKQTWSSLVFFITIQIEKLLDLFTVSSLQREDKLTWVSQIAFVCLQGLTYGLFVCLFIQTLPVISHDLQVRLKPVEV